MAEVTSCATLGKKCAGFMVTEWWGLRRAQESGVITILDMFKKDWTWHSVPGFT